MTNRRKRALEFQWSPQFHRKSKATQTPLRLQWRECPSWPGHGADRARHGFPPGMATALSVCTKKRAVVLLGAQEVRLHGTNFHKQALPQCSGCIRRQKRETQVPLLWRKNIFPRALCVELPCLNGLQPPQEEKLWWPSVPAGTDCGDQLPTASFLELGVKMISLTKIPQRFF